MWASTMSIFGKPSATKKEEATSSALAKLRETEEMLQKKQEFLERKIEQELREAKKQGLTNKRAALQALKRKKRYEQQLAQVDKTLTSIEYQREALEGAKTNMAVLQSMKTAANVLKTANLNMNIDKVHDLMDDVAEQNDIAREITDAISSPLTFGPDFDEDELEKELEEIEQELLDVNLLGIGALKRPEDNEPGPSERPTRLRNEPVISDRDSKEDEDLKKLKEWAS